MEPLTQGSSRKFKLEASKDGSVWDISGATVTLTLTDPDGNQAAYSATVTDGPAGLAEYTIATSVLDQLGPWSFSWKVVVGGITALFAPEAFVCIKAP